MITLAFFVLKILVALIIALIALVAGSFILLWIVTAGAFITNLFTEKR